jgi:magnesium chelatase family protein
LFACVPGSTISGIQGLPVIVEVDVAGGLPCLEVVGMADTALRESRHRVRSALRNSGFNIPSRRITVSLAPAAVNKEGSQLDAAIALGILAASGEIPVNERLCEYCYLGELALDGSLRPVRGALTMALSARDCGMKGVVVPWQNGSEVSFLEDIHVLTATCLGDLAKFIRGAGLRSPEKTASVEILKQRQVDLRDIRGQAAAKRALEVAAAGGHNILRIYPVLFLLCLYSFSTIAHAGCGFQ